ncbi:hypothetical protein [Roseivirga pacifica]|uniref:hypothetical protein n=1 Tax=Roseivirga pacifica TaxID=1267423 RepID=UPI003BB0A1FC
MKIIKLYKYWHLAVFISIAILLPMYVVVGDDVMIPLLIITFFQGVFQSCMGIIALVKPSKFALETRLYICAWLAASVVYMYLLFNLNLLGFESILGDAQFYVAFVPWIIAIYQYIILTNQHFKY